MLEAASTRTVYVPSIVAVEIAQKVWTGKLLLDARPAVWFASMLGRLAARELPLAASTAAAAYELPEPFHRDPADRIIVAETRALHAMLLTSDRRIIAYAAGGHFQVVAY